ncbi:hypothetical protein Tco_0008114 [Tanacetum coccineum]
MADPLSPDYVFNFLGDDPTLNIEDDPELDIKEDPEEDLEMDTDDDQEMDVPPVVAPPIGSPPISPPPLSESSSDSDTAAPVTIDRTLWHEMGRLRQDTKRLYGSVRTLTRGMETRRTEIATARTRVDRVLRHMDSFDVDVEQDRARVKEEIQMLRTHLDSAKISATLAAMDKDRIEMDLYNRIMPPRRMNRNAINRLIADRVAAAITEYEANRTNAVGARGAGPAGAEGAGPAGAGAKAVRSSEANKRKWEDHQSGSNNNRKNNRHHQQNKRQEAVRVYDAVPVVGRV